MHNEDPSESQQKTGKWMLIISWICALAILTMFFQNWEAKQSNPNQQVNSTLNEGNIVEVYLTRNKWGHYVFNGEINGQSAEFLVDTGASEVSVPESIAEDLNLIPGAALQRYTANGMITVYASRIPHLSIGDIHLYDVFATINPHMNEPQVLLGMSALKQVEFNQRGETLLLRQYR
ncbi:MAG TPA: TIGR02281 family clan AA aspartic protease [Pseudomonadales bacterium]